MRRSVEEAISHVVDGSNPSAVLDSCVTREITRTCARRCYIGARGKVYGGEDLRTFFDGTGDLRFATLDDVLIDPTTDDRLFRLAEYADNASVDSPLFDLFDAYVGPLATLYSSVVDNYFLSSIPL